LGAVIAWRESIADGPVKLKRSKIAVIHAASILNGSQLAIAIACVFMQKDWRKHLSGSNRAVEIAVTLANMRRPHDWRRARAVAAKVCSREELDAISAHEWHRLATVACWSLIVVWYQKAGERLWLHGEDLPPSAWRQPVKRNWAADRTRTLKTTTHLERLQAAKMGRKQVKQRIANYEAEDAEDRLKTRQRGHNLESHPAPPATPCLPNQYQR
jgi:hypothetical protein